MATFSDLGPLEPSWLKSDSTTKSLTEPPPVVNRLVQDVIRDQAVACPSAPAICSASVYLTYKELDDLSSRLALHIGSFGIGPNSIVPILCDKVSNFHDPKIAVPSFKVILRVVSYTPTTRY